MKTRSDGKTALPAKDRRVPKRRQRPKRPPRPMSIAAVCRAAAREGVSYGVYVLRHGV